MMYLIVNQYDYGDLYTYYGIAREISESLVDGRYALKEFLVTHSLLVAHLNALVFVVMPDSLYGLAIIAGCASFVFSVTVLHAVERHFVVPRIVSVLILFAPVLSMQSGYVGKETYVLPILGYIVYKLSQDQIGLEYWKILIAILAIGAIRGYQAYLILIPILLASMLEHGVKSRNLVVGGGVAGAIVMAGSLYEEMKFEEGMTIIEFLKLAYEGGALMLEPYPFPLSVLQNFRPFVWEAHNVNALVASFECSTFLFVWLWMAWKFRRVGAVDYSGAQRRLAGFVSASALIYLFIFGFNSNVGDLSRRHVYYYPFLLMMFLLPRQPQSSALWRVPEDSRQNAILVRG